MGTQTYNISDTLGYDIYLVYRRMRKNFLRVAAIAGIDITPEQWFTLNKLRNGEPMTQTALLDDGFNDRPNITRILSQLESKGWVHREDDPQDGRKHIVTLTKKGRRVHDSFDEVLSPGRVILYGDMDPDAIATTREVMRTLDQKLRDFPEDGGHRS